MAGRTFLDDPGFIPFPGGHLMDIFMAVFALNIVDEVGAPVMFCPRLLMAAMAGHWFHMNLRPLCLRMGFHIRNVPVAAIAGVGSMNRLGEFSLIDLIAVATEAFRIIDAFITVFPAPDDELLPLFCSFWRFGHPCGFGCLFFLRCGCGCPHKSKARKEGDENSKQNNN